MYDNVSIKFLIQYFTDYPVNKSFKFNGKWIDVARRGNTLYSSNQQKQIDKQAKIFLQQHSAYLYHITVAPDTTNQYASYKLIKEHLPRIRRYLKYRVIGFIDTIEAEYNGTGHIHIAVKSNIQISLAQFPVIPHFHAHIIESEITDKQLLLYIFKQQGIYFNIKHALLRLESNYPYPYRKCANDAKKLYNVFYLKLFNMRPVRYFTNPRKYPQNTPITPHRGGFPPVLTNNYQDSADNQFDEDLTDVIMLDLLQDTLPIEDQISQIQNDIDNNINKFEDNIFEDNIDSCIPSNNPSMDNDKYLTDYELILNEVMNYTPDSSPVLYALHKQDKTNNTNNISNKFLQSTDTTNSVSITKQLIQSLFNSVNNSNYLQEIRYNEYSQR